MDISQILILRYPGSEWTLDGDTYAGLTWLSESEAPTLAELESEWAQVQYEVAYDTVEKTRAEAYRQTSDPIFFQYQRGTATEQQWLDSVQLIKDANPYPEDPSIIEES
jgi:hypothetical protein